jgi:hypothetical protein
LVCPEKTGNAIALMAPVVGPTGCLHSAGLWIGNGSVLLDDSSGPFSIRRRGRYRNLDESRALSVPGWAILAKNDSQYLPCGLSASDASNNSSSLAILWFKFDVAPPNDLLGSRHYAEVIQKVANPHRYVTVLFSLSDNFWSFGDWMLNPILLLFAYAALQRLDCRMLLNTGWIQGVFILRDGPERLWCHLFNHAPGCTTAYRLIAATSLSTPLARVSFADRPDRGRE